MNFCLLASEPRYPARQVRDRRWLSFQGRPRDAYEIVTDFAGIPPVDGRLPGNRELAGRVVYCCLAKGIITGESDWCLAISASVASQKPSAILAGSQSNARSALSFARSL